MRKPAVLVTGANGEIGQSLIARLAAEHRVVAFDLNPLSPELARQCAAVVVGDILDQDLIQRIVSEYAISRIYHLAALLSTRAEYTPDAAHRVNVGGTLHLLALAAEESRRNGWPVRFVFPSSIAVYGLPGLEEKAAAGKVREGEFNAPITMYGCNKLYCEHLGRYYMRHYGQLNARFEPSGVDFRSIRFPGLISAHTVPSGGTSDFGPEMIHHAAAGRSYACFVPEEARIPFMAMPDAVDAIVGLADAPQSTLTQLVYNVGSFSISAAGFRDRDLRAFPGAQVSFDVDRARSGIVASWPADVDDSPARQDWGWDPKYDFEACFSDYLLPALTQK